MDDNNEELDEMQAQRENSLAEKSGKEAFKRQAKKNQRNQTIKKIWQKIPVAVKLFLLKLLIFIIIMLLILSAIAVIIDGIIKDEKENLLNTEYYYTGNHVVHTGMENASPVLTREQLEQVIQTKYTGEAQTNLMGVIDDLIYIQENYSVNAVFAIAVAQIESSCGTSWAAISPETYNWMSVTGSYNGQTYRNPNSSNERTWRVYDSFGTATRDFGNLIANGTYYFKDSKYDVNSIAVRYCNETWGKSVNNIMTEIYEAAGVQVAVGGAGGAVVGETADGFQIFQDAASGRRYVEYKQTPYTGYKLCHTSSNNTISSHGCALTTDAIIASGFGSTKNPVGVRDLCAQITTGSVCQHSPLLGRLTNLTWKQVMNPTWDDIIKTLQKGYPVNVRYKSTGSTIFGKTSSHFIALLALSEDGSQVYISNPGNNDPAKNGWKNISDIKNEKNVTLVNYNCVVGR